jgi:hypothetical protein
LPPFYQYTRHLLSRADSWLPGHDDLHLETYQLSREVGELVKPPYRPAVLHQDALQRFQG